ncbi:MAG: hypothetical protein ACI9Y1_002640 [Lentisphaeria bacterium]|jgi:hypothetical protein
MNYYAANGSFFGNHCFRSFGKDFRRGIRRSWSRKYGNALWKALVPASLLLCLLFSSASKADLSASIGFEGRYFTETERTSTSIFINPEYTWQSGNHSFYAEAFSRFDDTDERRSFTDIREALWTYAPSDWELSAGVGKVFWGVTESNHLVDIINQTDTAESADQEAKLGQAMIKWSTSQNWGTVDAYVLPYFRERRFSSPESPLSGGATISNHAEFESSDEQRHVDVALRYSQYFGDWDIGLYYFKGTNREPTIRLRSQTAAPPQLTPYYDQISLWGSSVQSTLGAWLWKLEAIDRNDSHNHYSALSAGFEYTVFGVNGSVADLGILAEYNYDSRGTAATSALQNDIFIGARLTLNDVQDTNFLIGLSGDLDYNNSGIGFIEANRRLGDSFRLVLDARIFESDTPDDPLYLVTEADHVSVSLEYFY